MTRHSGLRVNLRRSGINLQRRLKWRLSCFDFRQDRVLVLEVESSDAGLGLAIEIGGDDGGGAFAEGAIFGAESGSEVGVDVEFADDFAALEDGDDDFGFGFDGAGEITGIGGDVIDDDGFAGGSSGTADALIERDASVRGHGAFEGTEDENGRLSSLLEHVEADPVVAGEFAVEQGDDLSHEGFRGGCSGSETIEFGSEIGGFDVCVGGHEFILRGIGEVGQGDGWWGWEGVRSS
jgi:hypothetical protein